MPPVDKIDDEKKENPIIKNNGLNDELICPKCGSKNIHIGKRGYDAGGACCGAILLGPLGLLCGADGANKIIKTCLKCGKVF